VFLQGSMTMTNGKRRTIKDILGELEMAEKTHSKITMRPVEEEPAKPSPKAPPSFNAIDKDDITGLEHKIPVITSTEDSVAKAPIIPMEETPPPIPREAFTVSEEIEEEGFKDITQDFVTPQDIAPQTTARDEYSDSWSSNKYVNKIEELEQKMMKLEEESRQQRNTIDSQRAEIDEYRSRLGEAEADNRKLKSELSNAESNVKVNFEAQLNKATIIEEKYRNLAKLHEEIKAKVRRDIRKIRTREKELANKLELMKHDSETLLSAKDHKILQLKQQIDNLEFEIDNMKDKIATLQEEAKESEEKAERVVKALRLSTSLLEAVNKEK